MTLDEAVAVADKIFHHDINGCSDDNCTGCVAWKVIRKELAEALKPSHNSARDEICPISSIGCAQGKVVTICSRGDIFCPHVGQTSPVA